MKLNTLHSIILVCLLFSVQSQTASAQSKKVKGSTMNKAVEDFQSMRYLNAIRLLNDILATDSANTQAQEMLAYSYKQVKDYNGSLQWYEVLCAQKPVKPEWALNFAEALAHNQQYERSENWYRRYLTLVPQDKRAAAFARININNLKKDTDNWKISYLNINSQGSDYSPSFYKSGLLFSSNRNTGKVANRLFLWNNTPFTNLYVIEDLKAIKPLNPDSLLAQAKKDPSRDLIFNDDDTSPTSNDTKTLVQYSPALQRDTIGILLANTLKISPLRGSVNTKYHEGTSAVFPDGSIIFTRNNYLPGNTQTSRSGINKLKLFIASGQNYKRITEFPYNNNEYSTGHPTLSKDGNILIFTSDMPGGFGGTDLYYSVKSGSGTWTRPVNMGKQVNTEGNEMFPNWDVNGSLVFASTGHPGFGGLDLFEVTLKEMRPQSAPKNLGPLINSSVDDFGLIKATDGKSGFFTSNRRGDDNIYKFEKTSHSVILQGTIIDGKTKIPLAGSRLVLKHLDGADTIRTNAKGQFRKELPKETDFETVAQKLGYVSQLGFVTSVGITQDSVIRLEIKLNKPETAQQYVINNCDSLKKVFAVKNIYYDLDRSEIRSDARPALDELAALLKRYPETTIITSSHCDTRASETYNRNLSLRRGASAKAYLTAKGISASRIKVEYYGKTRLVNRCYDDVPCTEEDQQLNRRTEFDVILNGVNITQMDCRER